MAGNSGAVIYFNDTMRLQGHVSTTDSAGASTCLDSSVYLKDGIATYAGPTTVTSVASLSMHYLMMPELASWYPDEGVFEQCSLFLTGPPPVALTPANEIELPAMTLSSPSTTTRTSDGPTTTPTTSARPADSVTATPSRTTTSRPTTTAPAPPPEESDDPPAENDPPSNPDEPGSTPGGTPEEPDDEPAPPATGSPQTPSGTPQPDEDDEPAPPATQNPASPSGTPQAPSDDSPDDTSPPASNGAPDSGPSSEGNGAPVNPATTFSVRTSTNGGIVPVATGGPSATPSPAPIASPPTGFVQPITIASPAFVLPGATISQGGEGISLSGTSFSALPSNAGVVAISASGSTTIQPSDLPAFGLSTAAQDSNAFVLPSQTLAVGGSAVIVSGTTYSALPQGSGIAVAANGQSSVLAASEATSLPGVSVVDGAADGYVLDGSITVVAGGEVATISGTAYSALPSGLGVVVAPGGGSDELAEYIEQGLSGGSAQGGGDEESGSFVMAVDALSAAEDNAVTVSGVVYSLLPSSAGVLVVASGESTTIALAPTGSGGRAGDSTASQATGSSVGGDTTESVVPFAGAAASGKGWRSGNCLALLGACGVWLAL